MGKDEDLDVILEDFNYVVFDGPDLGHTAHPVSFHDLLFLVAILLILYLSVLPFVVFKLRKECFHLVYIVFF
jgi:hypothetical protein